MRFQFHPLPELAEFAPADLAARARGLEGMVFFDSAREMEAGANLSLLAVQPEEVYEGNLFESGGFQALSEVVRGMQAEAPRVDDGLPGPVVAGVVGYGGDFQFGLYRRVLVYRHREATWYGAGDWWRPVAGTEPAPAALEGPLRFEPRVGELDFCRRVRKAQEYIAAGDIYQVNLSHPLEAEWPGGEPWAFYEALRHYSPAPYAAYLSQRGRVVMSSSPELFLRFSGDSVRTRPIKGTRPRLADLHADERSAFDLITSPKEVAELVMITDLERSDLGQVCEWGSVTVSELLKLERYEQVFHLVSTVDGRLRPGVDPVSALRACFPGGSITGAPKKRAREIISELEGEGRGLYTGTVGWFGASGESVFNILIRTVILEGGRARFAVGAGVVADSIPEKEWRETWDKASGMLLAADRAMVRAGGGERVELGAG